MSDKKTEFNEHIRNWHINCTKGMIDAIIEVGAQLDYLHGNGNNLADGGAEALEDTTDDLGAGSNKLDETVGNIDEKFNKYKGEDGRLSGYIAMLDILRAMSQTKMK